MYFLFSGCVLVHAYHQFTTAALVCSHTTELSTTRLAHHPHCNFHHSRLPVPEVVLDRQNTPPIDVRVPPPQRDQARRTANHCTRTRTHRGHHTEHRNLQSTTRFEKNKEKKKAKGEFHHSIRCITTNHHNPPLSFSVGFFILSVNTNEWPSEPTRATAMYLCPFSHAMD